MANLLILGAGGHGKVIADIASQLGKWNKIAFADDRIDINTILNFPIVSSMGEYEKVIDQYDEAFIAIGNNKIRMQWINKLISREVRIAKIIHPSSVISEFSEIGEGTVVMPGTIVNADTSIGRGVILNTSSSIDHDCRIEDGVHISPGVHICGTVIIGRCSWICTASSIINNVKIGVNVKVAAGSTVLCNVPSNVMVAGTPAVIKKQLEMTNLE